MCTSLTPNGSEQFWTEIIVEIIIQSKVQATLILRKLNQDQHYELELKRQFENGIKCRISIYIHQVTTH